MSRRNKNIYFLQGLQMKFQVAPRFKFTNNRYLSKNEKDILVFYLEKESSLCHKLKLSHL